jgi:hypothetical protein
MRTIVIGICLFLLGIFIFVLTSIAALDLFGAMIALLGMALIIYTTAKYLYNYLRGG